MTTPHPLVGGLVYWYMESPRLFHTYLDTDPRQPLNVPSNGTGLLSYNHPFTLRKYMSNNQPNRRPNATPKQETPIASTIPADQEDAFVQRVWETTYSSCLATILAPRAAGITQNDKFLVRDIHKALELANIAKDAAKSYIQNQHKREEEELAAREGDPLNKLLTQDQP